MAAEELSGPRGDARRAESPFGRVATAEEVAAAVALPRSPEAEFTSGAVLDLNGASYLQDVPAARGGPGSDRSQAYSRGRERARDHGAPSSCCRSARC